MTEARSPLPQPTPGQPVPPMWVIGTRSFAPSATASQAALRSQYGMVTYDWHRNLPRVGNRQPVAYIYTMFKDQAMVLWWFILERYEYFL